jgi:hypothetical protein
MDIFTLYLLLLPDLEGFNAQNACLELHFLLLRHGLHHHRTFGMLLLAAAMSLLLLRLLAVSLMAIFLLTLLFFLHIDYPVIDIINSP